MATVIVDGDQVTTVTSAGTVVGTLSGAPGPLTRPTLDRVPISFERLVTEQTWPAVAVNWFVRQSYRCPMRAVSVVEEDGDTRETHRLPARDPVAKFVQEPWEGAGPGDLPAHLIGSLKVEGNSLAELDSGAADTIRALPQKWRAIQHLPGEHEWAIAGWRVAGRPVITSRMLHIASWAPAGAIGVSPLQQLGWMVRNERAAQEYALAALMNGASLSGTVELSEELLGRDLTERKVILDQATANLRATLTGPPNARKLAVMPPGAKLNELHGVSPVDAELIKQREVNREESAAIYGLPPVVLGILDDSNYSNLESLIPYSATAGLGPDLALIEQRLTSKLRALTGRPDVAVEFDMTAMLRGDFLKEIAAGRQATGVSTYTPKEYRDRMGLRRLDAAGIDALWVNSRSNVAPMGEKPPSDDTETS